MSAASRFRVPVVPIVILAAATLAPARADDAVPLALVAADLGLAYAYLPVENAVSLTRPGTVIVVRPGDGFFSVNARREPVYGMVPAYRDNDVVVSRAFEAEIRQLGRKTANRAHAPSWTHATAKSTATVAFAASARTGTVTTVSALFVASQGAVQIAGRATPGSRVTLVLRAYLAEDMPVVTLNDGETTADSHGRFATVLASAPAWFQYTRFIVEASAPGDTYASAANVVSSGPNKAAHTGADDALKEH